MKARNMMWRPVAVVCSGLTGMLIAACSSEQPTKPQPVPTPVAHSMTGLSLPISKYIFDPAQEAKVERASDYLTQQCMRRFGFDYPVTPPSKASLATRVFTEFNSRRYGVTNRESVLLYGYGLPPWVQGAEPRPMEKMSDAEFIVLDGTADDSKRSVAGHQVPPGGCSGEAERKLSSVGLSTKKGTAGPAALPAQILQRSFVRTQSDPRVLKVFQSWSTCMKERGYSYENPFKALGDKRWTREGNRPGKAHVETALADIDCKKKTNLIGVEYAIESEYQNTEIDRHAEELASIRKTLMQQLKAIEKLMGTNGS
ncbi:hypothetical protein [Actinomadura pelletieri]|nr:hypothetical protein [Actinomadura pelletieri]